jgi:hypothetical protein
MGKSSGAPRARVSAAAGGSIEADSVSALPPIAANLLRSNKTTRSANNGRERVQQWMHQKGRLLDNLVGAGELGSCTGDRQLIPDSCRNR